MLCEEGGFDQIEEGLKSALDGALAPAKRAFEANRQSLDLKQEAFTLNPTVKDALAMMDDVAVAASLFAIIGYRREQAARRLQGAMERDMGRVWMG